jgi:hypothetical protein
LKRHKLERREISKLLTQIQHARNVSRVAALVGGMVNKFGGINALVEKWYEQIQHCRGNRFRQGFATTSFIAIATLLHIYSQHQAAEEAKADAEVSAASGKELELSMRETSIQLMDEDPELRRRYIADWVKSQKESA